MFSTSVHCINGYYFSLENHDFLKTHPVLRLSGEVNIVTFIVTSTFVIIVYVKYSIIMINLHSNYVFSQPNRLIQREP